QGAGGRLSGDPGFPPGPATAPGLVDHFFRHEYGRLVATLTRMAGVRHVEVVEDAVQTALMNALTAWMGRGLPEDPAAWLYRAAYNQLIGELRGKAGRLRILERAAPDLAGADEPPPPFFAGEVGDDMLRMIFVCCDGDIP